MHFGAHKSRPSFEHCCRQVWILFLQSLKKKEDEKRRESQIKNILTPKELKLLGKRLSRFEIFRNMSKSIPNVPEKIWSFCSLGQDPTESKKKKMATIGAEVPVESKLEHLLQILEQKEQDAQLAAGIRYLCSINMQHGIKFHQKNNFPNSESNHSRNCGEWKRDLNWNRKLEFFSSHHFQQKNHKFEISLFIFTSLPNFVSFKMFLKNYFDFEWRNWQSSSWEKQCTGFRNPRPKEIRTGVSSAQGNHNSYGTRKYSIEIGILHVIW